VLDDHALALVSEPSSERVLGYPPSELLGAQAHRPAPSVGQETRVEAFAGALEQPGATVGLHFRLRHSDGPRIVLEATATNMLNDRSVVGSS